MAKDSPKKASKKRAAPVAPPSPVASSSTASSASPSPSRASSSSASPEPEVAEVAKEKNKKKDAKGAAKKDRKYKPPQGFYPITDTTGTSSADWATINADPDLELWAVRVPEGIKPRHLDGLTIQLPPTESDGPIATFNAKKVPYDLFMHPADNPSREKRRKLTTETACTGSEEMLSFVALLPKKAAGGDHLYEAPRPILHHLTIQRSLPSSILSHLPSATSSLIASQPSPVPGAILSATELLDPKAISAKRVVRAQPEGLKFRIALGGAGAVGGKGEFDNKPVAEEEEDVEMEEAGMAMPFLVGGEEVKEEEGEEEQIEEEVGVEKVDIKEKKEKKVKKEKKEKNKA